jgi:hypothetical protein
VYRLACLVVVVLCACRPDPIFSGTGMLNMQPARPTFVGAYDFDLLEKIQGKACVTTESPRLFEAGIVHWVATFPTAASPADVTPPRHGPTQSAIAAATSNAIEKLTDADTIVVTRVVTEGSASKVCAVVYGRGVRLKKAKAPPTKPDPERPDEHPDSDEK